MNKKASILIIGNEILSGKVLDTNTQYIAQLFSEIGIELCETRTIPDIEEVIISNVRQLSSSYDYLITTGGIGPTHDDITTLSVAKAFGAKYILNEDAKRSLEEYYSGKVIMTKERIKMAYIPEGATLIRNALTGAPGFRLKNVYVLAGIPKIMQAMLEEIKDELDTGLKIFSVSLDVEKPEGEIAASFAEFQEKYPEIQMGSYPYNIDGKWSSNLVLRSYDEKLLSRVILELEQLLKS